MKQTTLLIIISFLSLSQSFAAEVFSKVHYRGNQITIDNDVVAKALFQRINSQSHHSRLVYGLLFKFDKHLFCIREANRDYHCHIYMKDLGEGRLQNYETDHDFGMGSIDNYVNIPEVFSESNLSIENGNLKIAFEGSLADRMYESLDLVNNQYLRTDEFTYEKRDGQHINCVRVPKGKKSLYACVMNVPLSNESGDTPYISPSLM